MYLPGAAEVAASSTLQYSLLVALQAGVHRSAASKLAFMKMDGGRVAALLLPFFALPFLGCELRKGVTLALSSGGCCCWSWFFGRCSRGRVVGAGWALVVADEGVIDEVAAEAVSIIVLDLVGVMELYVPRMVFEPMIVET